VTHGLNAINHDREDGGQGLSQLQQTLVNEEVGQATGALWAILWHPPVPLKYGTAEQKREYLIPSCRGERRASYAITEAGAGSDPRLVATRADYRNGNIISAARSGSSPRATTPIISSSTPMWTGTPTSRRYSWWTRHSRACGSSGRRSSCTPMSSAIPNSSSIRSNLSWEKKKKEKGKKEKKKKRENEKKKKKF